MDFDYICRFFNFITSEKKSSPNQQWYFASKIVLTYGEKKLF